VAYFFFQLGSLSRAVTLSQNHVRQIAKALCRPVGTVSFVYSSTEAFRKNSVAGVLIEIPAGGHLFRLDRTADRVLRFLHSSPGTGTRVACIPLGGLPNFDRAFLCFTWSPEEINFYCGPKDIESELLSARGVESKTAFLVARNGSVIQIGADSSQVMEVRVQLGGQQILAPTALNIWASTQETIKILWTGRSDQGFIFEVVQISGTLSMLVTGLENYAKTRLLEIEAEGIEADWAEIFKSFASKAERESNRLEELRAEAIVNGQSILTAVVNGTRINFQNYDDLKRVYRAAYGIKLGEIGVDSQTLSELQELIGYRHRVVHVSPLLGMLNSDRVPPEEPVFANRMLADRAVKCFSKIVEALHQATLELRPRN